MNSENLKILTNIIGGVESGGQVYGRRNYAAYAAPYTNSDKEYTITLGWAQNYGDEAYKLISLIYAADPVAFDKIDPRGLVKSMINGEHYWVRERWNPTAEQKNILVSVISSEAGRKCQDRLFSELMSKYIASCEAEYTHDVPAIMMYCEIRHLGGKKPVDRIFRACNGNYSLDNILAVLKRDQADASSDNQVGDKKFWSRHTKCAEYIRKYAGGESKVASARDIMAEAQKWVGTKENPAGSNKVKFNTDYYGRTVSGSEYPWCCAFVWDVYHMCGADALFGPKTASCATYETNARTRGWTVSKERCAYGDVVTFDFGHRGYAHHIGFVLANNHDGTIKTIEGNTSAASQDNGGCVMIRTRSLSAVRYTFRPPYGGSAPAVAPSGKSKSDEIKALKRFLNSAYADILQQSIGRPALDVNNGTYGTDTRSACLAVWKHMANKYFHAHLTVGNSNFGDACKEAASRMLIPGAGSGHTTLVILAQGILGSKGYYTGELDGVPGPQTIAAIKRIESDGVIGRNGWTKLFK